MDLSGDDVQQRAEADRREVNPQIQVEAAIGTQQRRDLPVGSGRRWCSATRRRRLVSGWTQQPLIFRR